MASDAKQVANLNIITTIQSSDRLVVIYNANTTGNTGTISLANFKLSAIPVPNTVGNLPNANIAFGYRSFVTDANSSHIGFGNTVVGNGSIFMPVFSNGTAWIIG